MRSLLAKLPIAAIVSGATAGALTAVIFVFVLLPGRDVQLAHHDDENGVQVESMLSAGGFQSHSVIDASGEPGARPQAFSSQLGPHMLMISFGGTDGAAEDGKRSVMVGPLGLMCREQSGDNKLRLWLGAGHLSLTSSREGEEDLSIASAILTEEANGSVNLVVDIGGETVFERTFERKK